MRASNQRGLGACQLRSHRSQSPSGPCAEWRTQQPSSGCEGDDHVPDAHGRLAESPRWAWAGGCLGGKRRSGLRLRYRKKCRISFQAGLQHVSGGVNHAEPYLTIVLCVPELSGDITLVSSVAC